MNLSPVGALVERVIRGEKAKDTLLDGPADPTVVTLAALGIEGRAARAEDLSPRVAGRKLRPSLVSLPRFFPFSPLSNGLLSLSPLTN